MKNKIQLTGVALAVGAAAMFSMVPLHATTTTSDVASVIKCKGINACKGQGSCKTATNSCKSQNSCKGAGVSLTSKEECIKAGGTVESDEISHDAIK